MSAKNSKPSKPIKLYGRSLSTGERKIIKIKPEEKKK